MRSKRESAPNSYIDAPPTRGSNVPPAKPPHLPYTQYNGLSAHQLPLHQDSPPISEEKMPRGTERQAKGIVQQRIGNDGEVPFGVRGSGAFDGKPSSSASTSSTEKYACYLFFTREIFKIEIESTLEEAFYLKNYINFTYSKGVV